MTERTRRKATYADVLAAPENMVAEILAGVLHLQPRPASAHAAAAISLAEELGPPFKRGRGGPSGWITLAEPELHLGEDVLVPDLAGWRRTQPFPNVPYFELRPDWVCEVLSPSTERTDRSVKLPIYAREGVGHVWLVDPLRRTLEVYRLDDGRWVEIGRYAGEQEVCAEPFEAVVLSLGLLWADIAL